DDRRPDGDHARPRIAPPRRWHGHRRDVRRRWHVHRCRARGRLTGRSAAVNLKLPRWPTPGGPSIAPPRHEGVVRVGRRRVLGFAEYGDPAGRLVLWHHGTP